MTQEQFEQLRRPAVRDRLPEARQRQRGEDVVQEEFLRRHRAREGGLIAEILGSKPS